MGLGCVRLGPCDDVGGSSPQSAPSEGWRSTGHTVYVLGDTTNLHSEDMQLLVLQSLAKQRQHCHRRRAKPGRHQKRKTGSSSWGPGGAGNGMVVAEGTFQVAATREIIRSSTWQEVLAERGRAY